MISHFVVTRVDLRRPDVADSSRGGFSARVLDAVLRRSLARQDCQEFTLLTLWNRPIAAGALPNEVQLGVPDGPDQFHEVAPTVLQALRSLAAQEYTLLTRIDSDDAMAVDGIGILRMTALLALSSPLPWYLDAEEIFQMRPGDAAPVQRELRSGYVSPFVSMLDHSGSGMPWLDALMRSHGSPRKTAAGGCRVAGLRTLQLVHGHNLLNRVHGRKQVPGVSAATFLGEGVLDAK